MATSIQVNLSAAGTIDGVDLIPGGYAIAIKSTGTGTVDVDMLGPDGSTEITVASSTLATWAESVDLQAGTYRVVVTGFTAAVGGIGLARKF